MTDEIKAPDAPTLPSRFQIGDPVLARGEPGKVHGVVFLVDKVFYEIVYDLPEGDAPRFGRAASSDVQRAPEPGTAPEPTAAPGA